MPSPAYFPSYQVRDSGRVIFSSGPQDIRSAGVDGTVAYGNVVNVSVAERKRTGEEASA